MDEFPTALTKALKKTIETSTAPTVTANRQANPLVNTTSQFYDGFYDAKEHDNTFGTLSDLDSDMVMDVACPPIPPLPDLLLEEPDNTEVISINIATCKKEISLLHGQLPKEYHDRAKRLDEGLYTLMGALSNTMRCIGDDCYKYLLVTHTL